MFFKMFNSRQVEGQWITDIKFRDCSFHNVCFSECVFCGTSFVGGEFARCEFRGNRYETPVLPATNKKRQAPTMDKVTRQSLEADNAAWAKETSR